MQLKKRLEVLLMQVILCVIQVLSIEACARVCRWLAWLVTDVVKFRKKIIRENILGVYPDATEERIHQMATEMWLSLIHI